MNFRSLNNAGSRQQLLGCSLVYELLFRCPHQLSREERPGGSLSACAGVMLPYERRNPYPSHYKTAFAFSTILYPQPYRLTLRLTFPCRPMSAGRTTDLAHSARVPAWVRSFLYAEGAPSATGVRLAPAPDPSPFWPKRFGLPGHSAPFACSNANLAEGTGSRRLQKFTYVDPTTPPWPP
jgi:hypothetical protein